VLTPIHLRKFFGDEVVDHKTQKFMNTSQKERPINLIRGHSSPVLGKFTKAELNLNLNLNHSRVKLPRSETSLNLKGRLPTLKYIPVPDKDNTKSSRETTRGYGSPHMKNKNQYQIYLFPIWRNIQTPGEFKNSQNRIGI